MKAKKPKFKTKTINNIKKELTYFKLFVHVLFMGKSLFISKRVISIQLSKNNALQAQPQML
jgi:hypothetical protein